MGLAPHCCASPRSLLGDWHPSQAPKLAAPRAAHATAKSKSSFPVGRRVVRNMVADSPVPLSVKVRTGCEAGSINVRRVAQLLRDAGAAAVTIHGRTAEQRYSKTANWDLIASVVADGVVEGSGMPIVGNGDYEAR